MGIHKYERGTPQYKIYPQPGPPFGFEVGGELSDMGRVIVGVSVRAEPGDIKSMVLLGRELDPETGELSPEPVQFPAETQHPHAQPDVQLDPDSEDSVLGGLWVRAHPGNVTSMLIWHRAINENGYMEGIQSTLCGYAPPRGYEAEKILPDNWVLVGISMNAGPGHVTHLKGSYSTLRAP